MDRDLGASSSDADFRANPTERPMQGRAPSSLTGKSRWLALSVAFLIHAGILSFLLVDSALQPAIAPAAVEIPVEIVVETPQPQKPAEPTPEPTPPPPPLDLQPAYDAPRAANNEKVEREAPDEATKAPGAPTTATAPSANPTPAEAARSTQEHEARSAENSAAPVLNKTGNEDERAVEANREAPAQEEARAEPNAQPEKLPTFVGQPFPTWSTGAQFAAAESVPDIELGSAAGPTPISGGKGPAIYFASLLGMIRSHLHPPAYTSSPPKSEGAINFIIDGKGNVVQRQIGRESGSRDLDSAALAAVGEASPFPSPPQGLPLRLVFTYGQKRTGGSAQ
ncbi:MAG: TonB family protein [Roseiarcus sp.]